MCTEVPRGWSGIFHCKSHTIHIFFPDKVQARILPLKIKFVFKMLLHFAPKSTLLLQPMRLQNLFITEASTRYCGPGRGLHVKKYQTGASNRLNYYVMFKLHIPFRKVAVGRLIPAGRPRVADPRFRQFQQRMKFSHKSFPGTKILHTSVLNNLLTYSLHGAESFLRS